MALTYNDRLLAAIGDFMDLQKYVHETEAFHNANGTYTSMSVRQALRTIGVAGDAIDDVLALIYEGGFTYCLDSTFLNPRSDEYPPPSACMWGIDQLRSRLDCISLPRLSEEAA